MPLCIGRNRGEGVTEPEKERPSLPPSPSSTGKRYYCFADRPQIGCGQAVTLKELGGSWFSKGTAPRGFLDLESAVNYTVDKHKVSEVTLLIDGR